MFNFKTTTPSQTKASFFYITVGRNVAIVGLTMTLRILKLNNNFMLQWNQKKRRLRELVMNWPDNRRLSTQSTDQSYIDEFFFKFWQFYEEFQYWIVHISDWLLFFIITVKTFHSKKSALRVQNQVKYVLWVINFLIFEWTTHFAKIKYQFQDNCLDISSFRLKYNIQIN